MNRNQCRD